MRPMGLPMLGCAGLGLAAAIGTADPLDAFDGKAAAQPLEPVQPGAPGELSLTILETPDAQGPIEVRLESDAVDMPENRLGWEDVVDPLARQPRVRGRFVAPTQAGDYVVRGHLLYVTCGRKRCRPRRATVTWTVVVQQPPATDATASP